MPAKRRPSLVLSAALLAACLVAPRGARADDAERGGAQDVLTLSSGERLVGDLVDLRDGRYWLLLADGSIVSADMRAVVRVERGDVRETDPADLPLPDWRVRDPRRDNPIGGGFDLGLTTSAKLRFRLKKGVVSHVDARLGVGPNVNSGWGVIVGPEVAFLRDSPVHPTLTALVAIGSAGPLPFIGAGAALVIDPVGIFEARVGAVAGASSWGFDWMPELGVGFVW